MTWINPFSCIGHFDIIEKEQPNQVLLSAAASQLNKIMINYIKKKNPTVRVFGITRKPDQNESLISSGF